MINRKFIKPPRREGEVPIWREEITRTANQAFLEFKPDSVTLNTGTSANTVDDVQAMFDGNTYDIAEVTGSPGYDVEFNFTGIKREINFVVARWKYDGAATHFITIDIYNYVTSSWDQMKDFQDTGGYFETMTKYLPLEATPKHIDSSGNAKVRFYHHTSGNAAHDVYIDAVMLVHQY